MISAFRYTLWRWFSIDCWEYVTLNNKQHRRSRFTGKWQVFKHKWITLPGTAHDDLEDAYERLKND